MRYLVLLLLAGCSHASIELESPSPAAAVIAGLFIAVAEEAREPRPFPSFASLADWFRAPPTPELDPSRSVNEQDCTRPVELGGNLRCR